MTAQDKALKENTASAPLQIVAPGTCVETGEQAKVLNRLFTEWMDQGIEQFQFPHGKKLKEMVGHTPIEVLTGAALGIVLGFVMPMV